MSKGGGASSAPMEYYASVANSNAQSAAISQQVSMDQLGWAREQYNDMAPYVKEYETASSQMLNEQKAQGHQMFDRRQYAYDPLEDKFNDTAANWNSPARANQQAGAAEADIAAQYDQARASATANLESYGIDPSQTRFAALDLGTRVSQAAAQAGAGTQSRVNTEATGLSLIGEAINTGRGYASDVSRAYSGASQAGSAGVTAGLNTASTYGNLMGTGTQWQGLANQSRGAQLGAAQGMGQYEMGNAQMKAQAAQSTGQGIGSLVGTVGTIAALAAI